MMFVLRVASRLVVGLTVVCGSVLLAPGSASAAPSQSAYQDGYSASTHGVLATITLNSLTPYNKDCLLTSVLTASITQAGSVTATDGNGNGVRERQVEAGDAKCDGAGPGLDAEGCADGIGDRFVENLTVTAANNQVANCTGHGIIHNGDSTQYGVYRTSTGGANDNTDQYFGFINGTQEEGEGGFDQRSPTIATWGEESDGPQNVYCDSPWHGSADFTQMEYQDYTYVWRALNKSNDPPFTNSQGCWTVTGLPDSGTGHFGVSH